MIMENSRFELDTCWQLCDVNDWQPAQEYIAHYFYAMCNGKHYVYDCGRFIRKNQAQMKKEYFRHLPKQLSEWYFKVNTGNDTH